VFQRSEGYSNTKMQVPCGQCIGCRLERSRQWAIRCMHEQQMHDESCFLTLTYDDNNLPRRMGVPTLYKKDMTDFMKRLRRRTGLEIRYFQCGEYGEDMERPHHHVCLFGYDFPDRKMFSYSKKGSPQYESEELSKLWNMGYCLIGELNFESAAYVARYCTKIMNGDKAVEHYQGRTPEYATMSRNPGLGEKWYNKYKSDLYGNGNDHCVIRGNVVCKPPKYYDFLKELEEQDKYNEVNGVVLGKARKEIDLIKSKRAENINPEEHTDYRLACKHHNAKERYKTISKRDLENFRNDNSSFFN
jgi:hypothetical protein